MAKTFNINISKLVDSVNVNVDNMKDDIEDSKEIAKQALQKAITEAETKEDKKKKIDWTALYAKIQKKLPGILGKISFGTIIVLSIWVWLPFLCWKMGLILTDNFVKYFITDDKGRQ